VSQSERELLDLGVRRIERRRDREAEAEVEGVQFGVRVELGRGSMS
jgi:hypothetical protein